jgi:hypothetical protein
MNGQGQIEAIRKACIASNPTIETRNTSMMLSGVFTGLINHRDSTIRLADVLLGINRKLSSAIGVSSAGQFYDERKGRSHWTSGLWNLLNDDITAQSDECIDFIHSLLSA